MLRYISLRVLYTLPVIWLVVSLVFLLIHLVPGDPIQQMLGEGAPATDIQAARHAYGLDLPLRTQYFNYWKGVLHGDLGLSLRYNQNVGRLIAQRYPYTLQLTIAALVVAVLLSIPAGVRSAQSRNHWDDRAISVISLFGLSFPNFALGPVLILFFAIQLGWLPVSGSGSLAHLVLPAITMGGALAAILTRMVRTSMLEELGRPAECAHSDHHGTWSPVWCSASRRHRDRNDFFLAGNRPADDSSDFESRLLPGARLHFGDWTNVFGGKLPDRPAVLSGEPEDQTITSKV